MLFNVVYVPRCHPYSIMDCDSTPTLLACCDLHANVDSQAFICLRCKYVLAIASSQVMTHLVGKYGVSKESRKWLTQYLRQHSCEFKDLSGVPALVIFLSKLPT